MDNEPMWDVDCVVVLTPGSAITIPKTVKELSIKANLGASINLMSYSLYAKLSLETIKPTKMSVRLAEQSFQYTVGIAKNILVEVGKFTFPSDFIILEMEEDSKVPLILGRPFLHTVDTVIQVKQNIDVIDKILEDFNALLYEGSEILQLLEKDNLFEFDDECHNAFKLLKEKLTCTPLIISPKWNLPFRLICDVSDFTVGAILGQKDGKNFHPIYFVSKTLNAAMQNYTITKKDFMAVVFAFDKFRSYMVLSKIIVHTDHSGLRHLFKKQDAKSCLICWILILQEFDIEIKDRKGTKNVVSVHLSRIENDEITDDSEVDDNFPRETLMEINTRDEPWFIDFANYLLSDIIPKGMTYQQKNNFFSDLKYYFWEEPYLFKVCSDGMIRRCIFGLETRTILDQCHH
uniref:Reverse transcriptase domain-containing protein n=1 Tax=Tanacetum cinerariifolium TaxID=118510 RepID=A0A6L2L1R3_TANCI|nr:reverse transcriptase domain-containing protein [Tanacetum cinerariifolium]